MNDEANGCGCVLYAILFMFSCGLFLFLFQPIITIASIGFAGYAVVLYAMGVADALNLGRNHYALPVLPPPDRHTEGRDPAWPHYLYGPALTDYQQSVRLGFLLPKSRFQHHEWWIRTRFFRGSVPWMLSWPIGGPLWLGFVFGTVLGAISLAIMAVFQFAIWLVLAGSAFLLLQALRGLDTVRLRIKGIRLFCPSCHQKVVYPVYACPSCGRRHHDVRPGPYGVLTRKCACGTRMPTLLLLGSSSLDAYCPLCSEPMAERLGTAAEFVLPVLGAPSSGKTRLMLALMTVLRGGGGSGGASAEFADDPSRKSYEKFVPALHTGADTWKTVMQADAPLRGYSLYVTAGGTTRLLYLFDPAGEVTETSERMQAQRYLSAAKTFVFTLDQLSIDPVWQSLEVPDRARNRRYRSEQPPGFVFAQILSGIESLGVDPKRARLAVALTKQDLVRDRVPDDDGDAIRAWLESPEIGLDNMVRSMRHAFAEIRFFRTSSRLEDGVIDPAVTDLTRWILNGEGFRL